jgi:hypothetical protein
MELTPRQETQRKLWELVYAHASGDDMWPIMLNEFRSRVGPNRACRARAARRAQLSR